MYLYLSHARSPSPSSKNVIRRPDAFDQDQAPTSPQVTWGGACTGLWKTTGTREFPKLSTPNVALPHGNLSRETKDEVTSSHLELFVYHALSCRVDWTVSASVISALPS
jgi:hypothetical protein